MNALKLILAAILLPSAAYVVLGYTLFTGRLVDLEHALDNFSLVPSANAYYDVTVSPQYPTALPAC